MHMSSRRKLQSNLTIASLFILCLGLVSLDGQRTLLLSGRHSPSQQNSIIVDVEELPPDKGLIPVEIQNARVSSIKRSEIQELSYFVRNNTDKAITAIGIIRKIVFEEAGTDYTDISYTTIDAVLHADVSDSSRVKRLMAGKVEPMTESGPLGFGNGTSIKRVVLRIDYVEFDDNTALGVGSESERKLKLSRDGALKYKEWLVSRYQKSHQSLSTVLALLQEDDVPADIGIGDINQILGAKAYRARLLKVFQTEGATKVQTYLQR